MNDVLRLEITDLCNLKCKMCWSGDWKHSEMSWGHLKKLVYNFKKDGGKCIVLTSREPLLSGNFDRILKLCDFLSIELKLLSNGTLISKTVAQKIVKCNVLNYIAISLHGREQNHDDIVGVRGAYKRALNAIKYLCYYKLLYRRKDLEIRITSVISDVLMKDIESVISVADMFSTDLRIQHLMWYPENIKKMHMKYLELQMKQVDNIITDFPSSCDVKYQDVCKLLEISKKLCKEKNIDLQIYPDLNESDTFQWYNLDHYNYKNISFYCDHAMNSIRIRANGDVAFCQYLDMNLGNVVCDDFSSLINNDELLSYREKVQRGLLFPICYHCCHVKSVKKDSSPLDKDEI